MHGRALGLAASLALALPSSALAADSTCATLQADLTAAPAGSTVTLAAGESCSASFTVSGKALTLQGAGAGATFDTAAGRGLTWDNAGAAVVRNLTFRGTGGTSGGLEFTNQSAPTIDHVSFVSNAATFGGGLRIDSTAGSGAITIQGSTFTSNAATQNGGGLSVQAASMPVTITDSLVENNTATFQGGGAAVIGASVTISSSTFRGNTSGPSGNSIGGGLILSAFSANATNVTGNRFESNTIATSPATTDALGAGAYIQGIGTALTGNVFDSNQIGAGGTSGTWRAGGGGAALVGDMLRSSGNRFTRNTIPASPGSASGGAGVLVVPSSATPFTMVNDAVLGNTAGGPPGLGGALAVINNGNSTLNGAQLTIAGNTVGSGPAAVRAEAGNKVNLANSIVYGNTGSSQIGGTFAATYSDVCNGANPFAGTGNICADPLLAGASAGDGSLGAGSPALDRGSSALVPSGTTTDIAGNPRIAEGDADAARSAIVDMGAWERVAPACTPASGPGPGSDPTPTVTPPVTDPGQVLLCEGRKVVLIDLRRSGKQIVLGGLSLASLAGKNIKITADHGAGSATAKIAKDGSFTARVPYPKSDQVSYTASYGKSKSSPLKVSRNLTVVSQKKVTGGVRIVARHSKGAHVKGEKATVLRQAGCDKRTKVATLRFDKKGEIAYTLPLPEPPSTIAVYRVTTKVNNTFTLPIVVRR